MANNIKYSIFLLLLLLGVSTCKKNNEEPSSLTVTTVSVTEITSNSAKCNGNVSFTGNYTIGSCGSCWSESPSPTIDNYFTTDIQGQGNFVSKLKNLKSNTLYYVRAYAITSSGTVYGEELSFKTESGGGGPYTDVSLSDIYDIHGNSAKCDIEFACDNNNNITELGVCWSVSNNPMVYHYHVSCETSPGNHSVEMTNLESGTTYHVRAYAINTNGAAIYSQEEKVFSTLSKPQVSTSEITNITETSAIGHGVLVNDGGANTIKGFCWSTSSNPEPTTHDHFVISNGTGTGAFTAQMNNLIPNTTYFVRTFATNEMGTEYGNMLTFSTVKPQINEWLLYGDGSFKSCWGYTNGGTISWAVSFPSSMLSEYDGCKITRVKIYAGVEASYTLQIVQGSTNLLTSSYSLSSIGFNSLLVTPNVTIDSSQALFLILSCYHEAGEHPAGCGEGVGNPNARWIWTNSGWVDAYASGLSNTDLTWIIQAYVSNGKDEETELIIPTTMGLTNPSINVFENHGESTKQIMRK